MTGPVECQDVGERTRKALIRKRIGPPRLFEEPKVPDDLAALSKRRDPLIDRLEKIRDNTNLHLSQFSRDTIEEAIAVLSRLGWTG